MFTKEIKIEVIINIEQKDEEPNNIMISLKNNTEIPENEEQLEEQVHLFMEFISSSIEGNLKKLVKFYDKLKKEE